MTISNETLTNFLSEVKNTQTLWALQDNISKDWVVLDSINFEETEVIPLWSSEALAKKHCCEEWSDYSPAEITLAEWLEFWIEDLNEDGVIIGVNWSDNDECVELELADFSQSLATIEAL